MNERYLFRGKRVDNGEWIQGYLFGIWEKRFICWGTTNGVPDMVEVIPETIGQCTGLKDKNGKLIFEGDVCFDDHNEETGIAKYDDGGFVLEQETSVNDLRELNRNVEIVGNIHDKVGDTHE